MMRTKILYRLATGTCSVCLCYGLVVQALNGDMAAEALVPGMSVYEPLQIIAETQTQSPSAFPYEQASTQDFPTGRKGKHRGVRGDERWVKSSEPFSPSTPAESGDEEKKRVQEENSDTEDQGAQQTNTAGDPPLLSQFLSGLRCGGCRHNCCLLSPRCMKGRSKQQSATVQYTQTYGG